jgi:2-hydroxychromene-2-carboxylate isomerase
MKLEFWYEFASTYSYLSAMRIEKLAAKVGVEVVWKPFLLGPIFHSQGMDNSPFNIYPVKGAYMWRDMVRQCAAHGLPFSKPDIFPAHSVTAARLALQGTGEGWCPDFSRRVYHAQFVEGLDISKDQVLSDILASIELDADGLLELTKDPDIKGALRQQTEAAAVKGIFGAPSFVVGSELFWGDDRLEAALAFALASTQAD